MLVLTTNLPKSTERQSLTEFPLSGILNGVDVTHNAEGAARSLEIQANRVPLVASRRSLRQALSLSASVLRGAYFSGVSGVLSLDTELL